MDPLSALSLSCNVLQIVEYGAKLLSKSAEYHSAADGTLNEHASLREVSQSLRGLNEELAAALPTSSSTSQIPMPQMRLIAANNECMRLSNEFIELLDRLKVNKHSSLESFRMGIKSLWYESKLKSMRASLAEAKSNLNVASLVYLQYVVPHTSSDELFN